MNLEQISEGISTRAAEWGNAYRELLAHVPDDPNIAAKSQAFIRASFDALRGQPINPQVLGQVVCAASISNFRLGLLIGLLLDKPEAMAAPVLDPDQMPHVPTAEELQDIYRPHDAADEVVEQCLMCFGTGETCLQCGKSRHECDCIKGFDCVRCETCGGKGTV